MSNGDERATLLAAIVGPCPQCGNPHQYTRAEEDEMIETDAKIAAINAGLHAAIRSLGERIVCPRCFIQMRDADAATRRAGRIDALRRRTYREELIPAAGRAMTFADSRPELESENATTWERVRELPLSKNLWICGPPGVGKTFAARCALNQYLDSGRTAAEISAHRIDEIGRGWKPDQDVQAYSKVAVLLVEDIDKPQWHLEGVAAVWNLLDQRATAKLRTIVTSNITPKQCGEAWRTMKKANESRITSLFERLAPLQGCLMQGASFRRREREPGEDG